VAPAGLQNAPGCTLFELEEPPDFDELLCEELEELDFEGEELLDVLLCEELEDFEDAFAFFVAWPATDLPVATFWTATSAAFCPVQPDRTLFIAPFSAEVTDREYLYFTLICVATYWQRKPRVGFGSHSAAFAAPFVRLREASAAIRLSGSLAIDSRCR
jgi:hypothetical protein